jgi:hypothetical protein
VGLLLVLLACKSFGPYCLCGEVDFAENLLVGGSVLVEGNVLLP